MMLVKKGNHKRRMMPGFSGLLDDFLTSDFPAPFTRNFGTQVPSVNVVEGNDQFRIEVAAPGFKKEDFKVSMDNDILTISGEVKGENKSDDEKFTRKEFTYTSFQRSFTLPDTVEAEKIEANYEDGILKIALPKKEEIKKMTKEINIS